MLNQIKEKYGNNVEPVNPKAIPPFQEIENGHGFYGILLENALEKKVQCHICGNWRKMITQNHIQSDCKKGLTDIENIPDYKIEFGFLQRTPLMSNELVEIHRKNTISNPKVPNIGQISKKIPSKKRKEISQKRWAKGVHELRNRHGTCDLQLLYRLQDFMNRNKRVPNAKEVEWGHTAQRRFGTWENFMKFANATYKRHNHRLHPRRYTKEELLLQLKSFVQRVKRKPVIQDFESGELPAKETYNRYFGDYKKAIQFILNENGL